MQPLLERIRPREDASFYWGRRCARRFAFCWHFHPEVELTWIVRGRGRRFVGDHVEAFGPGDLVVLGANLPHTWATQDRGRGTALSWYAQFRPDALGDGLFERPEWRRVRRLLARASRGLTFSPATRRRAVTMLTGVDRADATQRTLLLLSVLDQLSRDGRPRALASPRYRVAAGEAGDRRVEPICRDLERRFTEPITQAEAAGRVGMDPATFSRFFRRTTGRTFTAYLTELRLGRACQLLIETELPVTSIALDAGFDNLSNFNRRFRQHRRCTPREYRGRFRT